MRKIGLISDTHGYLDQAVLRHLKGVDEIWHAGDIGNAALSDELSSLKPLKAVYGNIDGQDIRRIHPEHQVFTCENVRIYMTHIGGYPGNYSPAALLRIKETKPDVFICGHSHILKVMPDKKHKLLHMNPGAAGIHGFHKFRTLILFEINGNKIENLRAVELGLRGRPAEA